jgi:hypothetical protein
MARDTELAAELLNRERRLIERIGLEWAAAMDTGRPSREEFEAALDDLEHAVLLYRDKQDATLNNVQPGHMIRVLKELAAEREKVDDARREVIRLAGYGEDDPYAR